MVFHRASTRRLASGISWLLIELGISACSHPRGADGGGGIPSLRDLVRAREAIAVIAGGGCRGGVARIVAATGCARFTRAVRRRATHRRYHRSARGGHLRPEKAKRARISDPRPARVTRDVSPARLQVPRAGPELVGAAMRARRPTSSRSRPETRVRRALPRHDLVLLVGARKREDGVVQAVHHRETRWDPDRGPAGASSAEDEELRPFLHCTPFLTVHPRPGHLVPVYRVDRAAFRLDARPLRADRVEVGPDATICVFWLSMIPYSACWRSYWPSSHRSSSDARDLRHEPRIPAGRSRRRFFALSSASSLCWSRVIASRSFQGRRALVVDRRAGLAGRPEGPSS